MQLGKGIASVAVCAFGWMLMDSGWPGYAVASVIAGLLIIWQ